MLLVCTLVGVFTSTVLADNALAPNTTLQSDWREAFIEVPSSIAFVKATKQSYSTYCSCVVYAKKLLGRESEIWGNAWEIQPNSQIPMINSLILTTEGTQGGHIAVVVNITSTRVIFNEANYISCLPSLRSLPLDSPLIRGYKRF